VENSPGEDPYIIALKTNDVRKIIEGVRYNLGSTSSIRVEARQVKWGGMYWNEYASQWAVAF